MINTWGVTRRARDRMEQAGERGGAEERKRRLRWAARERTLWPSIDDELLLSFI